MYISLLCSKDVFAFVRTTGTTREEVIAGLKDRYDYLAIDAALELLLKTKSIVELKSGVYQRWHGVEAQKVLFPKDPADAVQKKG